MIAGSEARYRGLLEAAPDAMVVVNQAGAIVLLNVQAEKQFGYHRDELVGQPVKNIIPEGFAERLIADDLRSAAEALAQQIGTGIELVGRRKDGTEFPIEIMLSPLENAEGILVTAAIRNISVRKEAESQLLQAQKLESIGRLAGGIAHDFNNMLFVIRGYAELLADDLASTNRARLDPDSALVSVNVISNAAERAAVLTAQLLAFSRQQVISPSVLDLNGAIGGLEPMVRQLIGENMRLVVKLDHDAGHIRADGGQLDQILVNLVVNARDAMPDGGTVTIETENVTVDEPYAIAHFDVKPGPYVVLSVTDTGVGMDRATQDRIFEPFFTTKQPGKGTGLGLATTYGIVRQAGGHIWVYSEPGVGSRFKLYFPRVDAAVTTEQPPVAAALAVGAGKVLVVEDDRVVRDMTTQLLTRAGYEVIAVAGGAEAMIRLAEPEEPIEVLITDVVMPNMSGIELAEWTMDRHPQIGVVLLSGYTAETLNLERVTARGAMFVPKPVTSARLLLAIQKAQALRPANPTQRTKRLRRPKVSDPSVTLKSTDAEVRILVVDDDASTRALVASSLRRAGFHVIEAASGEAGLVAVETEAISLVVLDVVLPGMSGTDVVRALRERPQTATLPVLLLTGQGGEYPLVTGLGAGADDYLAKPVQLDELVARVRAHLRSHAAWFSAVEEELSRRSAVVEALGHLALSPMPEEAAETVVAELARRTACDFISVTQLLSGDRLRELATYDRIAGVRRGGMLLGPNLSADYVARARKGPWAEDVEPAEDGVHTAAFVAAEIDIGAGSPIYAGGELVGLLWLGVSRPGTGSISTRKSSLLATAIDYASILSAVAGPALADRRDVAATKARLQHALTALEFHPVFQPIVELESLTIVGYEALTRFNDGTRPDLRFAEAASVGLGHAYELAAIEAALAAAPHLPQEAFLTLNMPPGLVLDNGHRLCEIIQATARRLILELTEHVPIEDYEAFRKAVEMLGNVELAVDDTGAGFSSLRHILELRPAFAKLDISLVSGIDTDDLRQALVAGLVYFALRSGCHLIAEGVETENEVTALRRLGVEFAQGYLFGRPEPIAD